MIRSSESFSCGSDCKNVTGKYQRVHSDMTPICSDVIRLMESSECLKRSASILGRLLNAGLMFVSTVVVNVYLLLFLTPIFS